MFPAVFVLMMNLVFSGRKAGRAGSGLGASWHFIICSDRKVHAAVRSALGVGVGVVWCGVPVEAASSI